MKLRRVLTMGAAAAAALVLSTGTASAGDVYDSTTGSAGWGDFSYASKTHAYSIHLRLRDTAADGHHVRIRVQSLDPTRNVTSYTWRSVTTGYNTEGIWSTSLTDTSGIWALRIQVCTFEGDTALSCATSSWDGNNYY
ncbi:hypothetical protein GCM10027168_45740 [Streptomyces capparidis]